MRNKKAKQLRKFLYKKLSESTTPSLHSFKYKFRLLKRAYQRNRIAWNVFLTNNK